MRTKYSKRNVINVITLGCSKNMVDSEVMMQQLEANEFEVVHNSNEQNANIVIVNTCGFIDLAGICQYYFAVCRGTWAWRN